MDFGFSGVIEKFEEHWGKRATKGILLLIGLGVVAVCVGAIWSYLLSPLVELVSELIPNHPSPHAIKIAKFLIFVAFVLIGVNIGLSFFQRYVESKLNWRLLNRTREANKLLVQAKKRDATSQENLTKARDHLASTTAALASTKETIADLKAHLATAQALIDGTTEALNAVFAHAVERKMLTPEQVAELDAFSDAWLPPKISFEKGAGPPVVKEGEV